MKYQHKQLNDLILDFNSNELVLDEFEDECYNLFTKEERIKSSERFEESE